MRTVLFFSAIAVLPCFVPTPVASGWDLLVIDYLKVDVCDATTFVRIGANGPFCAESFMLSNPYRLVVKCSGAVSLLPPLSENAVAKGFVRSITSMQWDTDDATPVVRFVVLMTGRCCYTIDPRLGGAVITLEPCGPSWRLGYDEDRLVQNRTSDATYAAQDRAS